MIARINLMKKSMYLILPVICVSLTVVANTGHFKYNPDQLEQFNKTSKCLNCDLSGATWGYNQLNHSGANLEGSNLSNSIGAINVSEANLTNTNMTKVNFQNGNFSEADFTGSILYDANLKCSNLYGAKITSQQISELSNDCGAILPDGSVGTIGCSTSNAQGWCTP